MATYTRSDMTITIGGTAFTAHVLDMSDIDYQALMDLTDGLGDTHQEQQFGGLFMLNDITIGGLYDDTATTGVDAMIRAHVGAAARSVVITIGGSKTVTVSMFVKSFKIISARGKKTRYSAVLTATGSVTFA